MVEKLCRAGVLTLLIGAIAVGGPRVAWSASAKELNRDGAAALSDLRQNNIAADKLAPSAKGILVFPSILKAGFLFGGQIGEGVLFKKGKATGTTTRLRPHTGFRLASRALAMRSSSWTTSRSGNFESNMGFEIGVGPSIVVVDAGFGRR